MFCPLPPPEYDIHSLSLILNLRETKSHNQRDAVAWCMNPPLCERFPESVDWGAPVCAVLAAATANPRIRPKTDECRHRSRPLAEPAPTQCAKECPQLNLTLHGDAVAQLIPRSCRPWPLWPTLAIKADCGRLRFASIPRTLSTTAKSKHSSILRPRPPARPRMRPTEYPEPLLCQVNCSRNSYGNTPTSCGQGSIGIIGPHRRGV